MSTTYSDALRVVQGWTVALSRLDQPGPEVLAAAWSAYAELDRWATSPDSGTGRALTALRAEITAGENRALAASPGDPHYLPGWSGPRDAQGNVGRQTAEPEDDAEDLPQLAELMAAAEAEAPAWMGWDAPAAALPEEAQAGLVDRVAADLDGAADLITALAAELGVPKTVGDASSVNIARACASGAATLRALVPAVRGDVESAGERKVGTSAQRLAELQDMLTATRAELAEREAELEESGEELADADAKNAKLVELARGTEELRAKLAVAVQQRRQAEDRVGRERDWTVGRSALVAVLKALGTWAPGFEQMETEELGREAEKVARGVLDAQQQSHAAHQGLVRELRDMPGMAARSGPLVERVRAVLTEAERAIEAHQDCSDEWEAPEAIRSAELAVTELRAQLAEAQARNKALADQLDGMESELNAATEQRTAVYAELAKVRRDQPAQSVADVPAPWTTDLRPPSRGFAPHPDAPPSPSAPRSIEGITIPPVRPTPGITDVPAVDPDGGEPPL